MKRLSTSILTLLPLIFALTVNAENNWYLGASYTAQEISFHGRDFNTAGITAGFKFNKLIRLESRYTMGTSGYSSFYGTPEEPWGSYSEDIDKQFSLLAKLTYPIFEPIQLYGLAGYTTTEYEVNGLGAHNDSEGNITGYFPFQHTESIDGLSYGLGLDLQVSHHINVHIDYQVLPDYEPVSDFSESWDSTTIGLIYSF